MADCCELLETTPLDDELTTADVDEEPVGVSGEILVVTAVNLEFACCE